MQRPWTRAVCALGGTEPVAQEAAADLAGRYAEPHRRYHNTDHVQSVLRDSAHLAGELRLEPAERAVLTLAVCAHDVVYDARPGDDERRSADWARVWLTRAGVAEQHVGRVEGLVLATLSHSAPAADVVAHALLDADLAILGAGRPGYDGYRQAVRAEYSAVDDASWRAGRSRVLESLLEREPLFLTAAGRERWETAAKANLRWELDVSRS